jgi:Effector Associated Constant Component 1
VEPQELNVHVAGYPDSDAHERASLARGLQDELLRLDVERISRPSLAAPAGAKGSALEWAQLAVTFAGALPPLVAAARGWLARHPGASITLEIDGDRLELAELRSSEIRAEVAAWMKRHGA